MSFCYQDHLQPTPLATQTSELFLLLPQWMWQVFRHHRIITYNPSTCNSAGSVACWELQTVPAMLCQVSVDARTSSRKPSSVRPGGVGSLLLHIGDRFDVGMQSSDLKTSRRVNKNKQGIVKSEVGWRRWCNSLLVKVLQVLGFWDLLSFLAPISSTTTFDTHSFPSTCWIICNPHPGTSHGKRASLSAWQACTRPWSSWCPTLTTS